MEYVHQRGNFPDVPYEEIITNFKEMYPKWVALGSTGGHRDFATET